MVFTVLVSGSNDVFAGDDIDSNLTLLLFGSPTELEKLPACVTPFPPFLPIAEFNTV